MEKGPVAIGSNQKRARGTANTTAMKAMVLTAFILALLVGSSARCDPPLVMGRPRYLVGGPVMVGIESRVMSRYALVLFDSLWIASGNVRERVVHYVVSCSVECWRAARACPNCE